MAPALHRGRRGSNYPWEGVAKGCGVIHVKDISTNCRATGWQFCDIIYECPQMHFPVIINAVLPVTFYILSDIGSHIPLTFSISSLASKDSTISSSSISSSDALIYDSMEEHDEGDDENNAAVNEEVPELNDPLLRLREWAAWLRVSFSVSLQITIRFWCWQVLYRVTQLDGKNFLLT